MVVITNIASNLTNIGDVGHVLSRKNPLGGLHRHLRRLWLVFRRLSLAQGRHAGGRRRGGGDAGAGRSEEHTSELQSLMRISYAVFCLKKKNEPLSTAHLHALSVKLMSSTTH